MVRTLFSVFMVIVWSGFALAQQTPTEQALSAKLIKEINEGLSCSVALSQAQAKIAELEKQLAAAKKDEH